MKNKLAKLEEQAKELFWKNKDTGEVKKHVRINSEIPVSHSSKEEIRKTIKAAIIKEILEEKFLIPVV